MSKQQDTHQAVLEEALKVMFLCGNSSIDHTDVANCRLTCRGLCRAGDVAVTSVTVHDDEYQPDPLNARLQSVNTVTLTWYSSLPSILLNWLASCPVLKELTFSDCPGLQTLLFLERCVPRLQKLSFVRCKDLAHVGGFSCLTQLDLGTTGSGQYSCPLLSTPNSLSSLRRLQVLNINLECSG